jgi:hypothetical protein
MKVKILRPLVFTTLLLATLSYAAGQSTSEATNANISALKAQIQKREALEANPAIPSDLKEENRHNLTVLRNQLLVLLNERLKALSTYKTILGADATPDESAKLDRSIQDVQADLHGLNQKAAVSSTSETGSTASGTPDVESLSSAPGEAPANGANTRGTSRSVTAPSESRSNTSQEPALTASNMKDTSHSFAAAPGQAPIQNCQEYQQNPKTFSLYQKYTCNILAGIRSRRTSTATANATTSLAQDFLNYAIILLAKRERPSYIVDAEEARVDKQVGGGPANASSTSLVVKGGTPSVLGFAVENGALSKDTRGTIMTFRGNPIGIYRALANRGYLESHEMDENDPATRFLKKTSFSLSFDTNRGSQPGTFTGTTQQLSAYSIRYEFVNARDPRHKKYEQKWEQFLEGSGLQLTRATKAAQLALLDDEKDGQGRLTGRKIFKDPVLQQWFAETQRLVAQASDSEIETVLRSQLNKIPFDKLSPTGVAALKDFSVQFENYLTARKSILDEIAKGHIVSFEYTNNREVNAPDTSNFRFIAETGILGGKGDLTANASFTIFNTKPVAVNVSRVRDFQLASQLDVPIGDVSGLGKFVFSFAGRYERLMANAQNLAGATMPNTKGNIGFGQFKLTIPVKGSGVKIPFSVTFSNRSELIKEREVRANFGFTFDLDTIFAKFKPF